MPITDVSAQYSGWIDSHCHLNEVDNLAHNLLHASQKGIGRFVIPGTEPDQWREILSLRADTVNVAFGLHPWFISNVSAQMSELSRMVALHSPCAIGEIGLDYYEGGCKKPERGIQKQAFERQLELSKRYDLPVILHAVRSHQDVIPLLKRHSVNKGVVHAFVGSYEVACNYIDLGLHLGVGPMVFKSAKTMHAISKTPLDRLLLETDAPFLALRDARLYNPLVDLLAVADKLASVMNIPLEQLRRQLTANTQYLFQLS